MNLQPAEADTCIRFRHGQRKAHVESVFVKLNLGQGRAFWIKLTFLKKASGEELAEAWAIAFNLAHGGHLALKDSWPAAEASFETKSFKATVGSVRWSNGHLQGQLGQPGSGEHIRWDLRFDPATEGFRHLPYDWMYKGSIPQSKALSPQIHTMYQGEIEVNGTRTVVVDAPGMLGHNWGTRHAEYWAWAHCNMWDDAPDVVFEGVTSRVLFGPIRMPLLSVMHLRLDGEQFTLNGLWRAFRIKSEPHALSWRFRAETGELQLEGVFHGPPDRFVGLIYEDPDGRHAHCLNSKIADGELRVRRKTSRGWRDWRSLRSSKTSALEIGDRKERHGVPILVG